MSPISHALVTLAIGVLVGMSACVPVLWRQQRRIADLEHLATHDETTGLPNRRAILAHLRQGLADGRRLGVVLLDLDGFKSINDRHGHRAGDLVLADVGLRLLGATGPSVIAARLSGDEFVLLVHGTRRTVARVARTVWEAIGGEPVTLGDEDRQLSASVGYACARPGTTSTQLLGYADIAMYHAKTLRLGVCGAHEVPADQDQPRRHRDRR